MNNTTTWRDEFRDLLLQQSGDSFQAAIALKDREAPEVLFKFFRPTDFAFKNLAEQTVFLASPWQFNDPYDSGLIMGILPMLKMQLAQHTGPDLDTLERLGILRSDLLDLLSGKLRPEVLDLLKRESPDAPSDAMDQLPALFPQIMEQVHQKFVDERLQPIFQRGLKITCFSERADSLLLWAHYAAQHEGFCVEYGYRDMPATAIQRRLLFPVLYQHERFDLGPAMHDMMAGKGQFVPTHAIVAALHKALDWAYEREWRIVNPDGREDGFTVPMVKPRAVHQGLRINAENRKVLEHICASLEIPLLTPSLSSSKYEMVIGRPVMADSAGLRKVGAGT